MSTISRRTVAKGAAWSVPAIVVAAPAPALAASPSGPEEYAVTKVSVHSRTETGSPRTFTIRFRVQPVPAPSVPIVVTRVAFDWLGRGRDAAVFSQPEHEGGGVFVFTAEGKRTWANLMGDAYVSVGGVSHRLKYRSIPLPG